MYALMTHFIDTHAHLTDSKFAEDLEEVLARAVAHGVSCIIDVGDSLESSRRCLDHAGRYKRVAVSVGIHPNNAAHAAKEDLDGIAALADDPAVVAVGETGLDHYREWASPDRQELFLRRSLRLAAEKGLPVILHCRRAYERLISVLREERGGSLPGVLHCFSGNREDAEALLDMGLSISVGGPLTYPKNKALRETVRALPIDRILLETDSPYLPPQEARGKRNEPAFIVSVTGELARLRGMSVEEIAEATTDNAQRLFGKLPGVAVSA